MEQLRSASDVIDALGGTLKVQALTGRKYAQSVSNWRKSDRLPPDTFVVMSEELEKAGKAAPLSLWNMAARAEGEAA